MTKPIKVTHESSPGKTSPREQAIPAAIEVAQYVTNGARPPNDFGLIPELKDEPDLYFQPRQIVDEITADKHPLQIVVLGPTSDNEEERDIEMQTAAGVCATRRILSEVAHEALDQLKICMQRRWVKNERLRARFAAAVHDELSALLDQWERLNLEERLQEATVDLQDQLRAVQEERDELRQRLGEDRPGRAGDGRQMAETRTPRPLTPVEMARSLVLGAVPPGFIEDAGHDRDAVEWICQDLEQELLDFDLGGLLMRLREVEQQDETRAANPTKNLDNCRFGLKQLAQGLADSLDFLRQLALPGGHEMGHNDRLRNRLAIAVRQELAELLGEWDQLREVEEAFIEEVARV